MTSNRTPKFWTVCYTAKACRVGSESMHLYCIQVGKCQTCVVLNWRRIYNGRFFFIITCLSADKKWFSEFLVFCGPMRFKLKHGESEWLHPYWLLFVSVFAGIITFAISLKSSFAVFQRNQSVFDLLQHPNPSRSDPESAASHPRPAH